MKKTALSCTLLLNTLVSVGVMGTTLPKTVTPNVTIEGSTSDSIEIRSVEALYLALYSSKDKKFAPITIPFEVVSLDSSPLDYRLTLPFSSHSCEGSGDINVSVALDGEEWLPGGAEFTGALTPHSITLTYPVIEQKTTSQFCYGTLMVQAEVISI